MTENMNGVHVNNLTIGEHVEISKNARIICDKLYIGDGTVIGGNTQITCKECIIGENNFLMDVLVEGSLNAGETKIEIGDENLILQNTRMNCNDLIRIGTDVNIGQNVSIWTHASSMNVFEGYPFTKAPVNISSHVWITAGTTVLPGVNIGSHVIIGNSSIVNRNIPGGSFAAGCPVKVIKSDVYPINTSLEKKETILRECIEGYYSLASLKNIYPEIILLNDLKIKFVVGDSQTIFNCDARVVTGDLNEYSEDFRDYLRYRGIKIFINKPFKSIKPLWFINAVGDNSDIN